MALRILLIHLTLLLVSIPTICHSQLEEKNFHEYTKTAEFLSYYDQIAWHSSDSILKKSDEARNGLSRHWFIYFDQNENPHAVYGNFMNDIYFAKFHFIIDSTYKLVETNDTINQHICSKYSKAIDYAYRYYSDYLSTPAIKYNHYVYTIENGNIVVNLFPAFQNNLTAPFGREVYLVLDSSATKIVEDNSYFSEKGLRYYDLKNVKKMTLDYSESPKLHLGAIFFTYYYTTLGYEVILNTSTHKYTVLKNTENESIGFTWISMRKDAKQTKKKKNK